MLKFFKTINITLIFQNCFDKNKHGTKTHLKYKENYRIRELKKLISLLFFIFKRNTT